MTLDKKKLFREAKSLFLIFFGVAIYTFAISAFLVPHKIVGGGATGVATIVYYLTGEKIPIAIGFLVINIVLLAIGLKVLGPKFGVKTIFGIAMCTLMLGFWQPFFPVSLVSDMFMSTIIAGILCGVGITIAITAGGSTGGTDIVALLVNKYRNVSPGKVMMYCDGIIIAGTLLIKPNFEGLMYGYVMMGVVSFTVDFVLAGQKQSAQLFIFTDKHEEVAKEISTLFRRGVTVVDCIGWYTKQPKKIVIIVVRKSEAMDILKVAKHTDPSAFMTMNTVMGVFGQGFEEVKGVK